MQKQIKQKLAHTTSIYMVDGFIQKNSEVSNKTKHRHVKGNSKCSKSKKSHSLHALIQGHGREASTSMGTGVSDTVQIQRYKSKNNTQLAQ